MLDRCLTGGGTSLLGDTGRDLVGIGQAGGPAVVNETRGDLTGLRVPEDPLGGVTAERPRGGFDEEAVED